MLKDDAASACFHPIRERGQEQALGYQGLTSAFLDPGQWASIGQRLGLSPRELEIVRCVVDGDGESGTAQRLGISVHTVHSHLERLYRKLRIRTRCQLVVRLFAAYVSMDGRS